MKTEPIRKTVEGIVQGLSSIKKDTRQIVYNEFMNQLDEKEKAHVRPWSLQNNILTLHIDSPSWMYSLNFKKSRLLKTLQEKSGRDIVKEIRLKIGALK